MIIKESILAGKVKNIFILEFQSDNYKLIIGIINW